MSSGSLKVINTNKIHTRIYDQLRKLLLDGHRKAGEKIPSENELVMEHIQDTIENIKMYHNEHKND